MGESVSKEATHEKRSEVPAAPPVDPSTEDEFSWTGYLMFLAQRVFIYFSLYTLSIGPMYWKWYASQFVGGSSVVAAFYLPLVKLAEWIPPFGEWLDWYVNLWIA